ncbi:MAG: TIGR03087 family PEP-CTERM/XrtA system glycosyltransferase [Magnetococcales bacterium]|nr:TIGR03087 family PEP-CTERM/XrtA system glycosyltransferase [Magnetococcales bacterium]MBF0151437.1 TIGR03087 family PEP-CTERM/XrtA system glycosyltransferase [Magnetococcales bacterium]MBF0174381.1 TIGR03087 family PEP-CTERM/XrtA system glycosyltransferase [Magnetococcales bacterium]MBF0348792.1 TIGR03087 family PEP-CTERM/XrtA system glycosyltransferase [Magnetococcales bacterium]MBF0632779.1 TIGR03087 family PEP-CTERM/XrtA system glycosyltransferase [Magnetococcales bacterium]
MEDLLFLCHRIPYPPNKGDKVRSYHLLRFLERHYRVHLGAFIDDPADLAHCETVQQWCAGETYWAKLHPKTAKFHALRGLLGPQALTFHYYAHAGMQRWVDDLVSRLEIRRILVYSAAPSRFVLKEWPHHPRRVIDFVDVDSEKWRQYAQNSRGIMHYLHAREARTLLEAEQAIARTFDASLFVSQEEAELFQHLAPESSERIHFWENGVDSEFFDPQHSFPNPYGPGETLVFTGAMDYPPNVQAVAWFAERVFSLIRPKSPQTRFAIVGARPTRTVRRLARQDGIEVIGAVPDIRPYLAHARVAVAPLLIARGVQNKVLEAMAMARPVIATPQAMEGIRFHSPLHHWVTDKPELFAHYALKLLDPTDGKSRAAEYGQMGRQFVRTHYHWETNMQKILNILEA